jgi:hypothetical protein
MSDAPIFLSASVPYRELDKYAPDPVSIREAVRALVAVGVPRRPLVFGGHPAISPLVWEAADSLGQADRVWIYQSEHFKPQVPQAAHFFHGMNRLVWTPEVIRPTEKETIDESLKLMRDMMIDRRVFTPKAFDPGAPPDFPEYVAGVFIGGMDGIEVEWKRFRGQYPRARALLIASTAGATRNLMDDPANSSLYTPQERALLERDRRYRHVFRTLLP